MSKEGRKVKVIERDPTYRTASFPLSLGGFRRQFFQTENILLGKFAREFIFQIPELLKTKKNPKPTASMVPNGYLLMFGAEHAEEQYKALYCSSACSAPNISKYPLGTILAVGLGFFFVFKSSGI